MVLAAGFGTRLRPLTEKVPKPLLPVANRPLLEYTFALLARAGTEDVIVNTHHLSETFMDGLRSIDNSGLRTHVSREKSILGTAGGPKRATPFFDGEPFLLLNGDFLVDIDLTEVTDFHRSRGAAATMVLRESPGRIFVDSSNRIVSFLESPASIPMEWTETMFTGIHVLEPEILKLVHSNTPWEINRQVYPEMFRRKWPVFGFLHRGYWREAGDGKGFLAANLEMITGQAGALSPPGSAGTVNPSGEGFIEPVLLGRNILLEENVTIGPEVIIGNEVRIGRGSRIRRAVLLEGTDIPPDSAVTSEIRSPDAILPVS